MGWIWIFVLLNFLKSKLWKEREKRLLGLRQARLREKEAIISQMQDLPAWVQFPDIERVEWLNKVIAHAWPHIGEYVKMFLKEVIEPQVKDQLPSIFKAFRFEQIDMGDMPLRVGGIKVYTENVGRDRVIMDMDVAYAGDSEFEVSVGAFRGGLNQMVFSGKLRAVLRPLIPQPPLFGGITGFFLDDPQVDFNLTGLGELVELPGLMGAIRSVVKTQIRAICVLPNEIVVPLIPDLDVVKLHFPEPDGIIRVNILEAKNLENKDMTFIKKGKSDPYTHMSVGSQLFKTKVIDDNLSPIWDESFQAVVDQASGQRLILEVFDEDSGKDEELGRLALDLDSVRQKGTVDTWYPLEMCKHGDIHLRMYWMALSNNAADFDKQVWDSQWSKQMKDMPPAILQVYVDSASNLPYPKKMIEPSPLVQLIIGKQKQQTFHKPKTINPLYQQKFLFWINCVDTEKLNVEAMDFTTGHSLGEVCIPVSSLLKEPNMEIRQQTYSLALQAHTSPVTLTIRLRALVHKAEGVESWNVAPAKQPSREKLAPRNTKPPPVSVTPATPKPGVPQNNNSAPRRTMENGEQELTLRTVNSGLASSAPNSPNRLTQKDRSNSGWSVSSRVSRRSTTFNRSHVHQKKDVSYLSKGEMGSIHLAIYYNFVKNKLTVLIYGIEDLCSANVEGIADPYVKVCLVSSNDASVKSKHKTDRKKDTLSPMFNSTFEFAMEPNEMAQYNLLFVVKDGARYGLFGKGPVLGRVLYVLENHEKNMHVDEWFDLEPPGIV